jgi:phosphoglycolate phosphatase-like HAD superfamily hydrolase
MDHDTQKVLADLKPVSGFFIGIDSDGCAFDTMEIKHKECFCPNTVKYFKLQMISKYVREAWEFVNLYSKSRGCNRFHALIKVMELLKDRAEVKARHANIPDMSALVEWTKTESKLGNPALKRYLERKKDPLLQTAYEWSIAINNDIEKMVFGIPPFPYMRESLERMAGKADVMVVSQTPTEALVREWQEHGIDKFVRMIAGQEYGTKKEHIKLAGKGKYEEQKMLMIGDAPGDLEAARANGVLFFPINPGHEEKSWERFYKEGLDRFFSGTFAGKFEDDLVKEFESYLPSTPPWSR